MPRKSLEPRVAVLETKHSAIESRTVILENDMREIKVTLGELRSETKDGLQQVRNDLSSGLGTVVTGALDSMPKWAATRVMTSSLVMGAAGTLILTLVTVILWPASH